MKIVNVIGGLGNQMFQFAFAVSLAEVTGDNVKIDVSHFNYLFIKKYKSANLHNGYEIETVFPNASLRHATILDLIRTTWYCPNYILSRVVRKILPHRSTEVIQPIDKYFTYCPDVYSVNNGNLYYEGLWSSIKYYEPIKNRLKIIFQHPEPEGRNRDYISNMENCNSVGVHIRRGDYLLESDFMNICNEEYYKIAIEEVKKDGLEHTFYIFSNEMNWCKEHIAPLIGNHNIVYVTENIGKNSCWDMHLMTHCKDLIIANSSFSWWGAFLNNMGGRIIAPAKWMNRNTEFNIWADNWIRL